MKKLNFLKFGLTVLMMTFAMTLCYSCSSDDEENNNQEVNPPSNGENGTINGHAYVVLAGIKWATENVGNVESAMISAIDSTYGCYYAQLNAKKAAENWGGTWELPTKNQWQALINECNWTWNVSGMLVEGKKENGEEGNSIFLPAAGTYLYGSRGFGGQGHYGYYWSMDFESYLSFDQGNRRIIDWHMNGREPWDGMAVRPVSN